MAHTLDVKQIPSMLEELASNPRLTSWERGFCESISAQLDSGKKLSEQDGGQVDVLERIWNKY